MLEFIPLGLLKCIFPLIFIRPPGHHADTEFAMGYCFFNNVAVAARIAQKRWNVQRYSCKILVSYTFVKFCNLIHDDFLYVVI